MTFSELNLALELLRALDKAGYQQATSIQSQAIPHVLQGRDLLGCAQTGTGKTAAFAVPILNHLLKSNSARQVKALVLTPTRELALQIDENFKTYAQFTKLKSTTVFGGVSQNRQVEALRRGVETVIATPGRLLDLMQQGVVNLSQVEILVLDEADHMLDIGFINDIKRIIKQLPKQRQTLFFSATMPSAIRAFANTILRDAVEVSVTPVSSTVQRVSQSVYMVEHHDKPALLIDLIQASQKQRTLVFTRTKHGADKLVKLLGKQGIQASAIHGNKSQSARQMALQAFKSERIHVLVATDIAARGIDIDELPQVINFELPDVPETYVHRIGRTGRAGHAGEAISFCNREQKGALKAIQKLIGFEVPVKRPSAAVAMA